MSLQNLPISRKLAGAFAALIVIFAWRYRKGNKDATYDPDFDHSTSLELVIWSAG